MNAQINPTMRYRPRADAQTLSQLLREAWEYRYNQHFPEAKVQAVGAQIAEHIEKTFPAADMAVLQRYNVAENIGEVTVLIYNEEAECWNERVRIPLGRVIVVPSGAYNYYSGGPHDAQRRDHLPESLAPFFQEIVQERALYGENGRAIEAWVIFYKNRTGVYPLWSEILKEEPVLDAYVRKFKFGAAKS